VILHFVQDDKARIADSFEVASPLDIALWLIDIEALHGIIKCAGIYLILAHIVLSPGTRPHNRREKRRGETGHE
jgi:hypothetical protein